MIEQLKTLWKNKRQRINLILLLCLILLLPIGIYLVNQAQIFKPKASVTSIAIGSGGCVKVVGTTKAVDCPDVPLVLNNPFLDSVELNSPAPSDSGDFTLTAKSSCYISQGMQVSEVDIAWPDVNGASYYDIFENGKVTVSDQKITGYPFLRGPSSTQSAFLVKAKDSNKVVIKTSNTVSSSFPSCTSSSAGPSPTPGDSINTSIGLKTVTVNGCGEAISIPPVGSVSGDVTFKAPVLTSNGWETHHTDGSVVTQAQIIQKLVDDPRNGLTGKTDAEIQAALVNIIGVDHINCNVFFQFASGTDCSAAIVGQGTEADPLKEGQTTTIHIATDTTPNSAGCRKLIHIVPSKTSLNNQGSLFSNIASKVISKVSADQNADSSSCKPIPAFSSGNISTSTVAQGQTFKMTCNFSNTNSGNVWPYPIPDLTDTSFNQHGCIFDGWTNATTFTANFTCKASSCPVGPLPVYCTFGSGAAENYCAPTAATKIGELTVTGTPGPDCPTTKSTCLDGIDNNGDGKIDINDPNCHTDSNADNPMSYDSTLSEQSQSSSTPSPTSSVFSGSTECNDQKDNDGDQLTDTDDPECHSDGKADNSDTYDPSILYESYSYRLAQTDAGLADVDWSLYSANPLLTDFKLSNSEVGPKQIWVEFRNPKGETKKDHLTFNLVDKAPDITGVDCTIDVSKQNLNITLAGDRFGPDEGTILVSSQKITEEALNNTQPKGSILSWSQQTVAGQLIKPTIPLADGQVYYLAVIRKDLVPSQVVNCSVNKSLISLGAKVFCREEGKFDVAGVKVSIYSNPTNSQTAKPTKVEETVTIDKDGFVQGLKTNLQSGKKYIISIKAPHSVTRNAAVTASDGTTIVSAEDGGPFILPIGDIAPVVSQDGAINSLDRSELGRQWRILGSANDVQTGDFNKDGKVNSIDWACMRYDFDAVDDPVPDFVEPSSNISSQENPNPGQSQRIISGPPNQ